jgi:hypothetical protein
MAKNGGQKNAMSISADAGKAHLRAHLSLYFFALHFFAILWPPSMTLSLKSPRQIRAWIKSTSPAAPLGYRLRC